MRGEVAALPPDKRRAYAAHQNAYENFPFFAASVIIAITMGVPVATVNWLAAAYVVVRIAHGLLYVADAATARSLMFLAGLLLNIAILVQPALR